MQTLHNGVLWNGLRNILIEEGQKVWWIFDITRGEIDIPDLQVEGWMKPQEVPPFVIVMVLGFAFDMSSNLTHCTGF